MNKRQEDKQRTQEKILCAATQLFADQPSDRVSIGDIAELAGVSASTVSHYYPNRKELLEHCVMRMTRLVGPHIMQVHHLLTTEAWNRDSLRHMMLSFFEVCASHRDEMRLGLRYIAEFGGLPKSLPHDMIQKFADAAERNLGVDPSRGRFVMFVLGTMAARIATSDGVILGKILGEEPAVSRVVFEELLAESAIDLLYRHAAPQHQAECGCRNMN